MIRIPSAATGPGPLRRAGAVVLLALVAVGGLSACTASESPLQQQVAVIYEQAVGLTPERAQQQRRLDEAVLQWAQELDLADEIGVGELTSPAGDDFAAYGARDKSTWNRYRDRIEELSQGIRDDIRDGLDLDQVRAYYRSHPDDFSRQDELTLEITEWQDGRALDTRTIDIDETTVRTLQENDDAVISAALSLHEGEQVSVDRGDGRFAQVRCVRRTDAGVTPFDDVVQAAAARLANEIFDAQLAQRAAQQQP